MNAQTSLLDPPVRADAGLSADGVYRWWLTRDWDPKKPRAAFVMLNPSTADALQDDPTIRKCIGFARRWGMGGFTVVNLFAFRATDPRELERVNGGRDGRDVIGVENDDHILVACKGGLQPRLVHDEEVNRREAQYRPDAPALVVAAWGVHGRLLEREHEVLALFNTHDVGLSCLGTNDDGTPKHPLMLAYTTPLVPFDGGEW